MADLNLNTNVGAAFDTAIKTEMLEGVATQLGNGISRTFYNPLNAGPFAFAKLASAFTVAVGTLTEEAMLAALSGPITLPKPQAQITTTLGANNQGSIDLGDGNILKLNANNSELDIVDTNTGHTTQIWGDPHVNVDGKQAFNFAGTTSFVLKDGTKITINTQQWAGNPNAYVANQLVITRGSQAVVVNGLSQNNPNLSITTSNNGYALDAATRDGYVVDESKDGSSWVSEYTGKTATQDDMNATMVGGQFGPGSTAPSLGEIGHEIGAFLSFGILGAMLGRGIAQAEAASERQVEHKIEHGLHSALNQMLAAV